MITRIIRSFTGNKNLNYILGYTDAHINAKFLKKKFFFNLFFSVKDMQCLSYKVIAMYEMFLDT